MRRAALGGHRTVLAITGREAARAFAILCDRYSSPASWHGTMRPGLPVLGDGSVCPAPGAVDLDVDTIPCGRHDLDPGCMTITCRSLSLPHMVAGRSVDLVDSQWRVVKRVRNPWGQVPLTDGGRVLTDQARAYMERLASQVNAVDPGSRRHHYVPRAYLQQWSTDGKRVWALDTASHEVKLLGLRHVCVEEDFYRVVGRDGAAHNRVELMFGVVDAELRRVQRLFDRLEDPDGLEFDDLLGLGVSMAMQRMRTAQERRLRLQHDAWLVAQDQARFKSIQSAPDDPNRLAGIHTELIFQAMWKAADVMTTRQIEVWHDDRGRFMTCDAPVLVPYRRNARRSLVAAPYILWPVSPHRVVALANEPEGQKAVMRDADGRLVGMVRLAIEQGRERMIFATEEQRDRLPYRKLFHRRAQVRLRCSERSPTGEFIPPPGCCVESSTWYGSGPDVVLCSRGLHLPAPEMWEHT